MLFKHGHDIGAQGNLTFKEALKYSGGNRDGREEGIKIASGHGKGMVRAW